MKTKFKFLVTIVFLSACGPGTPEDPGYVPSNATMKEPGDKTGVAVVIDQSKGEGRFSNIKLNHPLDEAMAKQGNAIYLLKCSACHQLTDKKVVGPGWKGITDQRKPEWIMNFMTNTDEMLNKDAVAQEMLKQCVARMPDPHITDVEARQLLEFMQKNDGKG